MYKHPLLNRDLMTPREALDILVEGNARFMNNYSDDKDFQSLLNITKDKQHPFASFLSCSDSRAPVELLFDQALGDIFSVRLAGNIASDKAIGSLEFSSKYLGSKLIVSWVILVVAPLKLRVMILKMAILVKLLTLSSHQFAMRNL